MQINVLTLFPELIENYVAYGVIGRACREGKACVKPSISERLRTINIGRLMMYLFGGGAGMVLKPEPLACAMDSLSMPGHRVLLTPSGRPFTQKDAVEWAKLDALTLICGRYEGVDQRFADAYVDETVSIGDYVLSEESVH